MIISSHLLCRGGDILHEITKTFLSPNKKEITVYKIFRYDLINNRYLSLYGHTIGNSGYLHDFVYPDMGKWISCYIDATGQKWPDILIDPICEGIKYSMGFHSYMNYDQAEEIFLTDFKDEKSKKIRYALCECRAKFRLYYGIINYVVNTNKEISSELCISRGIKIFKELEV